MAPSPPRLRILSGKQSKEIISTPSHPTSNLRRSARSSLEEPTCPHSVDLDQGFDYLRAQYEFGTKKILYSRRKRSLGIPVVATSSNECMRCHSGVETESLRGSPIWYQLQVHLPSRREMGKTRPSGTLTGLSADQLALATSVLGLVMVRFSDGLCACAI